MAENHDLDRPLTSIDHLRLWVSDPETFAPIDIDDAEEILMQLDAGNEGSLK